MFSKSFMARSYDTSKQDIVGSHLLVASRDGHFSTARAIIEKENGLLNVKNIAGNTPLHLSVIKGHLDITELLVKKGADIHAVNDYKHTPFHSLCYTVPPFVKASEAKKSLFHFENVLILFLNAGLDLNGTANKSQSYLGNLAQSGALEAMQILIKHGAEINIKDQFGFTPLHNTAVKGHFYDQQFEVAKWLVNLGADVNAKTFDDKTPLELACETNHSLIVNLLNPTPNFVPKARL